jgi:hypothetical protein
LEFAHEPNKIGITSNDTSPNYLNNSMIPLSGFTTAVVDVGGGDEVLTIEIDTGWTDSRFVTTTGVQTVADVKTFSSSPIVPTPTTDFQASTKKYVDDNATSPGGSDGDLQINNSGVFGTIDGLNLDKTGNARGTGAIDIQSARTAVTDVASATNSITLGLNNEVVSHVTNGTAIGDGNFISGFTHAIFGSLEGVEAIAIGKGNNIEAGSSSRNGCIAIGFDNDIQAYTIGTSVNSIAIGNGNQLVVPNNTGFDFFQEATAVGTNNTCSSYGLAFGKGNTAGKGSMAIGSDNDASGGASTAIGNQNKVYSETGIGFGFASRVEGLKSTLFGNQNVEILLGGAVASDGPTQYIEKNNMFGIGNSATIVGTSSFVTKCNFFGDTNTVSASGVENITKASMFGDNNTCSASTTMALGSGIINSTANSVEVGPANASKIRVSSAGLDLLTLPMLPASMADGSAPNNSVYYSTTASKLVYKDAVGTVNNLY